MPIEKSFRGSLFWHHKALPSDTKHWSRGTDFSICTKQLWQIFFLAYLLISSIGVTIYESRSYTLMSAILKIDVICNVIMMSTPNVLTTELPDLLYNQSIDNTCCNLFFIYPMGRIWVCKIRFVNTGENRRKPCLVCKKKSSLIEPQIEKICLCHMWTTMVQSDQCLFICCLDMGQVMRKCVLCRMWTTKVQINLRIRTVLSAPLLFAA